MFKIGMEVMSSTVGCERLLIYVEVINTFSLTSEEHHQHTHKTCSFLAANSKNYAKRQNVKVLDKLYGLSRSRFFGQRASN